MKKTKAWMAGFLLLVFVFQMAFGALVFADDTDMPEPAGAPNIAVVNGPVFEVEAGKENEVEVQVRNLSSSLANSILVMPKLQEVGDNPMTITLKSPSNNISSISGNASRKLTFLVNVDPLAEAKTYAVDVEFSFFNNDQVHYSTSSTIYFKVTNYAVGNTRVTLSDITLSPSTLEAGETGTLTAKVNNPGPLTLLGVNVNLTGLDSAAISAVGVNSTVFPTFPLGESRTVSFEIMAAKDLAVGNYPVTFEITGKDANGASVSFSQQYYVSVGNAAAGEEGEIVLQHMQEPSGTYGINENFPITFDLYNKGKAAVEQVKVTAAEYGEGGNVVPKSASVVSFDEIAPGQSVPVTFTFAATANASSRNYTIEFTISYTQDGETTTLQQYAGANIINPEKDEEEEEEEGKVSKPKIIVSEYQSDPRIFTPVDSSNTFYFDSIAPKGTVDKSIRLYTMPDAQPKTYTITVNFEYEDLEGNEFTATELLGINVKQSSKVETSEISMPPTMELGMYNSLYFDIYNTGNVELSNVKVLLSGDVDTQNKSTYLGNCAKGDSLYYEGSFAVLNVGENNVVVTLQYSDPSGEVISQEMTYTIEGTEPAPMDPTMMDDPSMMAPEETGPSMKTIVIGAVCGVVVLIVIVIVVRKIKKKRADAYITHLDDEEEEDEDEENEQPGEQEEKK